MGKPLIVPVSTYDDAVAAEKGRLLAARAIATDPEARKRVVDAYGEAYVRARYPEAFARSSRFSKILDRLKFVGR
jgi:hypothetical protein